MGIKNDEVNEKIKENIKNTEQYLNSIEEVLFGTKKINDETTKLVVVSNNFGKIQKNYQELAYFLGIFDDNPKNKG